MYFLWQWADAAQRLDLDALTVVAFSAMAIIVAIGLARAGQRNRSAREDSRPVVKVRATGVTIRDMFTDRPVEVAWKNVEAIGFTESRGIRHIWLSGRLGRYRPYVSFETDEQRSLSDLSHELYRYYEPS